MSDSGAARPPQLIMRRSDLDSLPELTLPDGYTLHRCDRAFADEERRGIARVLADSFPEMTWFEDRVDTTFIGDAGCRATFYIRHVPTDEIVATATAREDASYPGEGYLHWVGVSPAHRGKRLGGLVSLAVLHDFAATGCRGAVLNTDDHRLPAIRTYQALGFAPVTPDESHAGRWRAVESALSPPR